MGLLTAGERSVHEIWRNFRLAPSWGKKTERLVLCNLYSIERLAVDKRVYNMSKIYLCKASYFWDCAEL